MAELEKTINALGRCESYGYCEDKKCPYYECVGCLELLRKDALSLIQQQQARIKELETAQTARVMTLEEAQKRVEIPLESRDPVFYEDRILERAWWIWNADDRRTYLPAIIGGIGRFWTSRPTDEQRKAVKWDE